MSPRRLVSVELRFLTTEDPDQLADRLRESVATIVGRDALEEFRVRTLPLETPKRGRGPKNGPKGENGKLRPVE